MKANELMLGDYVTFKECQKDTVPTIIKIWQINGDNDALVSIDNDDALDEIAIDEEIVGIQITPKILEKNGFSQDLLNGHIFIFHEKYGEVIYYEYGPKYGLTIDNQLATIQDLKINYVHELQHALRLCGIEKEIVL